MSVDPSQNQRNATQGETTPISARDSATGLVVPWVGDDANNAIRVNVVAGGGGGGGGTQFDEGSAFTPGDKGTEMLAVSDDGSVPLPDVGDFSVPRTDPTTGGLFTAPKRINESIGPFAAVEDEFTTQAVVTPQCGLSLFLVQTGGGLSSVSIQIFLQDAQGNETPVFTTLTSSDLGALRQFPVPGPFYKVRGACSEITGSSPTVEVWVSTSPEPGASQGLVDDGNVNVPHPGLPTPFRIDPVTHGVLLCPGSSPANLGKAEGATPIAESIGVAALGVRASDPSYRFMGIVRDADTPTGDNLIPTGSVNPISNQWQPTPRIGFPTGTTFNGNTPGVLMLMVSNTGTSLTQLTEDASINNALSVAPRGASSLLFHLDDPGGTGFGTLFVQGDPNGQPFIIQSGLANSISNGPMSQTTNDHFAATGNGAAQQIAGGSVAPKHFSIQVVGDAGVVPTAWDVRVEVSLDGGTTFGSVLTHTNADGNGAVKGLATPTPGATYRARCAGLTLGLSAGITVYICAGA